MKAQALHWTRKRWKRKRLMARFRSPSPRRRRNRSRRRWSARLVTWEEEESGLEKVVDEIDGAVETPSAEKESEEVGEDGGAVESAEEAPCPHCNPS
mmetsp:Transcript_66361/g.191561  ORF Transcript_66361/g.191561 Transcript_66361/m.191561 type:complete len:97 (-) Transcript_66361:169-459(-)